MLKEIDNREILSNTQDSTPKRVNAIIRIAAQQLEESLDDTERKNLGTLTDYSYEQNVQRITEITNKVLQENYNQQIPTNPPLFFTVSTW